MTSLIDYILSLFRSEDAARSFVAAPGRAMTSAGLIDIAPHQISSVAANVVPGLNLGAGDPMSGLRQAVAARHGFAQDVANVGFAGDAGAGVASVITTDVGAGLASGLGAGFLGQGGLALAASSGGFGGQVGLAAQVGLGFTAVIEAEVGAQVGAGLGIGTGLGAQAGMGFGGGVGLGLGGQAGGVIGGSAAGAIGAGVGGRLGGNGQIGVAGQGAVGAGVGAGVGGQAGIASQIGVSAGGGLGGVGNVSGLTGVSSNAVLASNASGQAGLIASEGAALNGAAMPHLSGPLAGVGVGGQAGAAGGAGLGFRRSGTRLLSRRPWARLAWWPRPRRLLEWLAGSAGQPRPGSAGHTATPWATREPHWAVSTRSTPVSRPSSMAWSCPVAPDPRRYRRLWRHEPASDRCAGTASSGAGPADDHGGRAHAGGYPTAAHAGRAAGPR